MEDQGAENEVNRIIAHCHKKILPLFVQVLLKNLTCPQQVGLKESPTWDLAQNHSQVYTNLPQLIPGLKTEIISVIGVIDQ